MTTRTFGYVGMLRHMIVFALSCIGDIVDLEILIVTRTQLCERKKKWLHWGLLSTYRAPDGANQYPGEVSLFCSWIFWQTSLLFLVEFQVSCTGQRWLRITWWVTKEEPQTPGQVLEKMGEDDKNLQYFTLITVFVFFYVFVCFCSSREKRMGEDDTNLQAFHTGHSPTQKPTLVK